MTVAPLELEEHFRSFAAQRGLDLSSSRVGPVLDMLLEHCRAVRIKDCDPAEEQDYLHFEGSRRGISLGRMFNGRFGDLYDDGDPAYADYREKWGLGLNPEPHQMEGAPDCGAVNLFSFDFPTLDAFAHAVRASEIMTWALHAPASMNWHVFVDAAF